MDLCYNIDGYINNVEINDDTYFEVITDEYFNAAGIIIGNKVNDELQIKISGISELGEVSFQDKNIALSDISTNNFFKYYRILPGARDIEIIPSQFATGDDDVFNLIDHHTIHSCAVLMLSGGV